jgi:hypothetical protein
MTEKRQTSQGYIILILKHFATKLWNITNFAMLFQVVMKFLSRLVYIKISLNRGKVYWNALNSYAGTTSNRTRTTFRTNGFPCPRTINVKECFKFVLVEVRQFILDYGSRAR